MTSVGCRSGVHWMRGETSRPRSTAGDRAREHRLRRAGDVLEQDVPRAASAARTSGSPRACRARPSRCCRAGGRRWSGVPRRSRPRNRTACGCSAKRVVSWTAAGLRESAPGIDDGHETPPIPDCRRAGRRSRCRCRLRRRRIGQRQGVAAVGGRGRRRQDDLGGRAEDVLDGVKRRDEARGAKFPKETTAYRTLRRKALQTLVQEARFEQKAVDLGVKPVTKQDVDAELAKVKQQLFGSKRTQYKYTHELAKEGVTEADLRADLYDKALEDRLYAKVISGITITSSRSRTSTTRTRRSTAIRRRARSGTSSSTARSWRIRSRAAQERRELRGAREEVFEGLGSGWRSAAR